MLQDIFHHHGRCGGASPFSSNEVEFAGRGGHGRGGHHGGHGRHGHGHNPFGGNPFGGNPFGGNPFSFFRRTMRARRGDIRAAVLSLLTEKPLNGYQIMQELAERSQGLWRPSPGSVYPALQQLEDEGLVSAEPSGSGRLFSLTAAGRKYAQENADELSAPWEVHSDADGGFIELMKLVHQTGAAAAQVAHAGSPKQLEQASKVLADARRSLYRILAEDAPEEKE